MEQTIISQGPVNVTVGPIALGDDNALARGIGNVASAAAKSYLEKSNWADRESAKRLRHPLYALPTEAKPELIDAVCRATLMSKTTAEFAVLAVLDAFGALSPSDGSNGPSA